MLALRVNVRLSFSFTYTFLDFHFANSYFLVMVMELVTGPLPEVAWQANAQDVSHSFSRKRGKRVWTESR